MANYPIKMLKDESGTPFVPLTHMDAVKGLEYVWSSVTGVKGESGHYNITNTDLSESDLLTKILPVQFDNVENAPSTCLLSLNGGTEYTIFSSDGTTSLGLSSLDNRIVLLQLTNIGWKLVDIPSSSTGLSGHAIEDRMGQIMTQRNVLKLYGIGVGDSSADGATTLWGSCLYGAECRPMGTNTYSASIPVRTWTNLLDSDYTIPYTKDYIIICDITLSPITDVGREIGLKIGDRTIWDYQFSHYSKSQTFIGTYSSGTTINPQIYIDELSTATTATLTAYKVWIIGVETEGIVNG